MDLKRYLSEAEQALTHPAVGDEFDISINEVFNLETEVLESNEDGVTLAMDDRGMAMLEELGALEEEHDKSPGGPYDRGSADAYYGRPRRPHKMAPVSGGVQGQMAKVDLTDPAEVAAYNAGYSEEDDRKDWGESVTNEGAEVPYKVLVVDTDSYDKKTLEISAVTSSEARDKAEAQGYKVLKISDSALDTSESVNEDVVNHATHGAVYGKDGKAKLFMTRNEAEEVADAMAKKHGGSGISIVRGPFTGYMVKMPESQLGEAVDKAQAERKLRNKYHGGNPKVTFHRGYAKVSAAGKEYHHKIHKGQVEDDPTIIADESISEAEYQGRQVKLGKPMAGDVKKYKVYVRAPSGNVKKVNFGDKNMEIKRDNPERRKNFRARHNCSDKKDRTKAGYWACRLWSKKPVSKIV